MPAVILTCVFLALDLVMSLVDGGRLSTAATGFMLVGAAGYSLLWPLFAAVLSGVDRVVRDRDCVRRFVPWIAALMALPVVTWVAFQITSGDGISASRYVWPLRTGGIVAGMAYAWAAARLLPAARNRLLFRISAVAVLLGTGAVFLAVAMFEPVAYAEVHRVLVAIATLLLGGAFALALPALPDGRSRLFTEIAAAIVVVVFCSGLVISRNADRKDEAMMTVWRHTVVARQWQYPLSRLFPPNVSSSDKAELVQTPPVPAWSGAPFKGKNVVVVVMDAFRDDRIGMKIDGKPLTPNISRLVDQSVRFRGVTNYTHTLGSLRSVSVGSWNVPVGELGFKKSEKGPRPQWPTAAELFKAQGYETAAFFHSNWRFAPDNVPGFDTHERPRGDCHRIIGVFQRYLSARQGDQPLFAWFHLYDTHTPIKLGKKDKRLGKDKVGLYNSAVFKMDRCVGVLTGLLEKHGLSDNTVLVLMGDHGEALGEHRRTLKHSTCYAHDTRIPMVFHVPWMKESRSIDHYFQSVDLVPTMASLFGLDTERNRITGRDLSGFFNPDSREKASGLGWAFSEGHKQQYPCAVLDWEGWRMIYNVKSGTYELYDSESDPGETENLMGSLPDIASRMLPLLDEYRLRKRPKG